MRSLAGILELQITGACCQKRFIYQQYCGHLNQRKYNISLVLTKKPINLETIGSIFHIQNGRHKNTAESEKAPYISNQPS